MSRFGWMYANSAMSGAVANGPTNSIQINSGSQVLTGTSNFTYNPVTNTVTLAGLMTGSSLVISASVISASTYLGIVGGGGSSTPGGTNTTIQFNSGSTFSGSTNLIYNYTTNVLSGTTVQFTVVTASAYSGGSFVGSTVSGTTAQFTILTASVVSASTYLGITAGATPGGTNTAIQFNSGSSLSGSSNLTFNYTTNVLSGTTAQFTILTASAYSGGSFIGTTVSGTTAEFTILTGSTVTGSTALFNVITASAYSGGSFIGTTVSGTAAQFTSITASAYSSSGDIQTGGGLSAFGNINTQGNVQAQAIAGRYRTFAGNFTVATNSWFCAINSSGAAVTASLGLANTYYPGQQITFKDVGGFAAVSGKGILIQASGSDKIDGASSLIISATSGSVTVISDGSGSFYITSIV
jgi:hypothetical protein